MSPPPTLLGAAAFLTGCFLVLNAAEPPLRILADPEAQLFERVNAVREQHHLKPLRASHELSRVASSHAEDMASSGYLAHVNRSGLNPLQRVQAAGIGGFRLLAENIGDTNVSGDRAGAILEAWMRSPIHRENVLNPAFNSGGLGMARTPDGRLIAVQLYATF